MTTPLIDMRGIVKTFNIGKPNELTILKECDLQIAAGELIALVGASGSGKSTMMNIIGLLDKPTAGTYLLNGEDVLGYKDDTLAQLRSKTIGFVFQNFNLISRISAKSNVEMPMMYAGIPAKERARRAEELLAQVGMSERMSHMPSELSGGQCQRVAIARALANDPAIILADEPTGALDTETGEMVMELFQQLNAEQGTTIAVITHNPELAKSCQRTVTMVDGRIIGTSESSKANSNSEAVTAALRMEI
ncbi:ABC transporter ATP-binding protein [Corynebacterium caspium]|uniref:ABC transporter ATP-binding protein n=1 Tax=Corynebacterium caspium TaxID=234828 RepID=UPI001B7FD463|nr:ABC transporter ATP-binding protein [Corynebacterium caspium]